MKIKDLCSYAPKSKIKAGEAVDNAEYMFFTSSADENKRYIDFQYNQEAIIMGTGGNATLHYYNGKFSVSTDCLVLLPSSQIKCKYLYYFFKSHMKVLEAGFKGAGLKHTNKKYVEEIEINEVPNLIAQEKIIYRLDKVMKNIEKLNKELELFDSLVKARFIEMFGNFVYERDRWNVCTIGDVAVTIDPQPSHRTPPISLDGIPYVGIAECNYSTRRIDFEKARKVGQNVLREHTERYTLDEGDFIIGKIGTIGKPFFIPIEQTYTLSANTVLIKPIKGKVVSQYLYAVFQSEYMDRIIDAEKKSTSQPAFGIQKVRRIEIPMPPLELQQQFAAFVAQTDKSKFIYRMILS